MKVKAIGFGGVDAILQGQVMPGLQTRKKLSYSNGFGFAVMGKSRLGDDRFGGGIYQKRVYGYNQYTGAPPPKNRVYFVKMRSYAPTNPRTVEQQAHRAVFADAVAAWAALTDEEKTTYNRLASKRGRVGRNLFMSEYLRTH